jgi:L-asparagine transporter-like permease
MAVMTAVNLVSARSYGEFEFWFASIKVAAILVFIALAAAYAFGLTSPTGNTFGNLTAFGGFAPKGAIAVLSGAVAVYFSLTGAQITTIAAAESREGARAVLAGHGDAPAYLVQLNARRVPTCSVWLGSIAGVLGILAATAHSQKVFASLVNASGALMVFVYMMIVVAHLRVRRSREASGASLPALQMWLFPWANYLALTGMVAVLVAMAMTPQMQRDFKMSALSLGVAVAAYLILEWRRRAGTARRAPAAAQGERP